MSVPLSLPPPPSPPTPLTPPDLLPFLTPHLPPPTSRSPTLLAISGPQGSGKSHLAAHLAAHLATTEFRTLILSLDDFYHPHCTLLSLSAAHPTNPLLRVRGNPGTHDVALLAAVLRALKRGAGEVRVPRYDKSAHGGRGDRAGWEVVRAEEVRVVVLEGWCVGYFAVGLGEDEGVGWVDARLREYEEVWRMCDAAVVVVAEVRWVYEWRVEQERETRERRGAGMTEEEVRRFVDAYMPAYGLYLGRVGEGWLEKGKVMRVRIDKERAVRSWEIL